MSNDDVKYTIKYGGRKLDKPKLNFRLHNPNMSEDLTIMLLRVCIDANIKKVEQIVREEAAVAIDYSTGDKNEYSGILQGINGQGGPTQQLGSAEKILHGICTAHGVTLVRLYAD